MIFYVIIFILMVYSLVFVGKEVVCDIRNPHKGQVNHEESWSNIPKTKTRAMYSSYER